MNVVSSARALSAAVALGAVLGLAGCGPPAADAPRPTPPMPTPLTIDEPVETERPRDCPRSGMLLSAGEANAAMGLRVQTMTLTNCGKRKRQVSGYPRVRLLDEQGDPVKVKIDRGARRITTAVRDPGAKALTVRPGRSVRFGLVWRNTYEDTTQLPKTGTTVVVVTGRAAEHRITLESPVDLGSTSHLGVTAWEAGTGRSRPDARPH
ncbi:DUF4232 domain-containing protein [Nonomuraea sp. LPB2021202275-12-8]|uniref:DUF4232 domain-containing protein n=1 Tax=Nonomuraea sp. LPB2021202275-12-8 TaxID=3120159 RepID=UPI00300DA37A